MNQDHARGALRRDTVRVLFGTSNESSQAVVPEESSVYAEIRPARDMDISLRCRRAYCIRLMDEVCVPSAFL